MLSDGGYSAWTDLFIAKVVQADGGGMGPYTVAGRPTLSAWMVEEPFSGNATQVTLVRNPYYWKVDQTGQQYPYIDKLVYGVYQDIPSMLLKALNGEIDFQMRHFNTLANKAVLYDNMQTGDYRLFKLTQAGTQQQRGHAEPDPQRPGHPRDLPEQRFPHWPVLRHQPPGDHQHGLRDRRQAISTCSPGRDRVLQRSSLPPSTSNTMLPRPTNTWTKCCPTRTPTASACAPMASR